MEGNAITVKIGAETDQVEQGLRSIQASLGRLEQSSQQSSGVFDSSFQKIAGAFTVGSIAAEGFQKVVDLAFSAAQAVVQGFSDALDLGGRLNELSARTGETAGKLLVLETAFKNSGLEANAVGTAINKLQNFMADAANGGDRQTAAMDRLGISMADLSGKTPTEQMGVFASKIAAIEDPTARAAAASEIFGDKLGGKLLPVLTNFSGNLEDARAKVGSLEQVMDENAATFDAAGESIDAIKGKFAALAAGILSETIPALKDLGTSMEQVDAAALGSEIGQSLSPALERLAQITIGANASINELIRLFTTAPSNTTLFGRAINTAAESLNGFNYWMNKAFTYLTPFGAGMEILRQKGEEVAATQNSAASAMGATATQAQAAATATQAAGESFEKASTNAQLVTTSATGASESLATLEQSATTAGSSINSSFQLTGDYKANIDGISSSFISANEQILQNKSLLESTVPLTAQISADTQSQALSLGGVNEQLTLSQQLEKIISGIKDENVSKTNSHAAAMAGVSNATGTAGENAKQFSSWLEYIEGTQPEEPVKKLSEKSAEARKEIEAFGKYIGTDLAGMSYPDIAKELKVDILGKTGSQQIDAILAAVKAKLPDGKLTQPIDEKQSKKVIGGLGKTLETDLKKSIDIALKSSEGTKVLNEIKSIAAAIRTAVEKIEPKLPQRALA